MPIILRAENILKDIDEKKDVIFNVRYFHDLNEADEEDVGERTYSAVLKNAKEKYNIDSFYDICSDLKNKIEDLTSLSFQDHYERHDFNAENLVYVKSFDTYYLEHRPQERENWDLWKQELERITDLECVDLRTSDMDIRLVSEIMHGKKKIAIHHIERSIQA